MNDTIQNIIVLLPSKWSYYYDILLQSTNNDVVSSTTLLLVPKSASFLLTCLFIIVTTITITTIITLLSKRYYSYYILKYKSKLPTVLWQPKFLNYTTKIQNNNTNHKSPDYNYPTLSTQIQPQLQMQMPSSTITNVLPRMKRLNGPYGMYGTVYGISTKVVHIAHPFPGRLVLQSTSLKEPAYNHFKNFCGDGVFTSDGAVWKRKRASVSVCLRNSGAHRSRRRISNIGGGEKENESVVEGDDNNNEVILSLEEIVRNAAQDFMKRIHEQQQNQNQPQTKSKNVTNTTTPIINVLPILQRITLSIIYQHLTHQKLTEQQHTEQHQKQQQHESSNKSKSTTNSLLSKYLDSIIKIRMIVLAQSRSIWFLLPYKIYKLFSPMYKEEEHVLHPIRQFAKDTYRHASITSPLYLLKSLVQQQQKKNSNSSNNYHDYSKNESDIEHETITLLFAGQDTSAATLSWILHLLSIHPHKQYKLLQEIKRLSNPNTTHNSSKMTYLDAVIKESMRLYPVAPFVVRKLTNDILIPDNKNSTNATTTTLYKGTYACIWIYGMHHNTNMWTLPDQFIPERWLLGEDKGIAEGAFMPFAVGPRNCLGQAIATFVVRNMLKGIISHFSVIDPRLLSTSSKEEDFFNGGFRGRNDSDDDDGNRNYHLRRDMQAGFTILPLGGVPLLLRPHVNDYDDFLKT